MKNESFQVINNMKKFIEYLDDILVNYPHKQLVLRDKIEKTSYDMLSLTYYANTIENRLDLQKRILSMVAMLDFYIERSYNLKCINIKAYKAGEAKIRDIRKIIYGWIKSNDSKV